MYVQLGREHHLQTLRRSEKSQKGPPSPTSPRVLLPHGLFSRAGNASNTPGDASLCGTVLNKPRRFRASQDLGERLLGLG